MLALSCVDFHCFFITFIFSSLAQIIFFIITRCSKNKSFFLSFFFSDDKCIHANKDGLSLGPRLFFDKISSETSPAYWGWFEIQYRRGAFCVLRREESLIEKWFDESGLPCRLIAWPRLFLPHRALTGSKIISRNTVFLFILFRKVSFQATA